MLYFEFMNGLNKSPSIKSIKTLFFCAFNLAILRAFLLLSIAIILSSFVFFQIEIGIIQDQTQISINVFICSFLIREIASLTRLSVSNLGVNTFLLYANFV
jgi:hypothetical protein